MTDHLWLQVVYNFLGEKDKAADHQCGVRWAESRQWMEAASNWDLELLQHESLQRKMGQTDEQSKWREGTFWVICAKTPKWKGQGWGHMGLSLREKSGLQRSGQWHRASSSGPGRGCNQQGRMCGVRRHPWWKSQGHQGADDETPTKEKEISKR